MHRRIACLALLALCLSPSYAQISNRNDPQVPDVDETLDWNAHLIDGLFAAGTAPPPALRIAAIMQYQASGMRPSSIAQPNSPMR